MTDPISSASSAILVPVLFHILWVCVLYILLVKRKKAAAQTGEVDLERASVDGTAWPLSVQLVSKNIANNFEVPVLFYGVCIASYLLGTAGGFALSLAWVFVFSRVVHSWIHVNSNFVPLRMKSFVLGLLCVLVMVLQTLLFM